MKALYYVHTPVMFKSENGITQRAIYIVSTSGRAVEFSKQTINSTLPHIDRSRILLLTNAETAIMVTLLSHILADMFSPTVNLKNQFTSAWQLFA